MTRQHIQQANSYYAQITNFTKYFEKEREVFVQNISSTQISLYFNDGSGMTFSVIIPRTRRPYNLTQDVPFEVIKRSMDFRKIVNRPTPVLRLIDESDFVDYYQNLAIENSTSFEEEYGKALELKQNLTTKVKLPSESMRRDLEQKAEDIKEQLEKPVEMNPRIIGLCAQADKDLGMARISASDFIEELKSLENVLSVDDWEFVSSRGVYKTVKDFASKKIGELTISSEE
jgi:hypothetical protein